MKTVDREKLWESYQKNPVSEIREQIIIEYAPLVKLVAGRLSMYLGYNVEYEDKNIESPQIGNIETMSLDANSWKFIVSDIKYGGYVNKGQVFYKKRWCGKLGEN